MYLLDSNVLSELRKSTSGRANRGVVDWAAAVPVESLFVSAITMLELEKGVQLKALQDAAAGDALRRWLDEKVYPSFHGRVLPVDLRVAIENGSYHVPDPRPLADSLIAATAKVHGLQIVTRNVKDFEPFEYRGVRVLNPWN